jgi:hypothetical protein
MRFVVPLGLGALVWHRPESAGVWLLVLVVTVLWIVHSAIWPQRDCRHCDGGNKHRDPVTGVSYHSCGSCDGGRVWRVLPKLIGRDQ